MWSKIYYLVNSLFVDRSVDVIRNALAMGADKGIHVVTDMTTDQQLQPLAVAKIFKQIMETKEFDMCFIGKQAIDDDSNQTGQMMSAFLGWSQATFASAISLTADNAIVTREIDGGLETIKVKMPTVITVDLRLNEPRYASLPNIMKAKKKPMELLNAKDMGVDLKNRIEQLKVEEPPKRKAGIKVASVAELVSKLKNEAKVI